MTRSPVSSPDHGGGARLLSVLRELHPGPRVAVVALAIGLVVGGALVTADNVANHLAKTATDEAIRSAATVAHGYVDPLMTQGALEQPQGPAGDEINRQLERLVSPGGLLRIKIWSRDGQVLFSDLAELRGQSFPIGEDLEEALEGEISTEFKTDLDEGAENVYERGLAERILEIYLPITQAGSEDPVAAYEIYEDASPIEAGIAETRHDVFIIASAMAFGLLVLLWSAFGATSRLLARQNRRLLDVTGDLGRSEARFRSLVQNSSDIFVVLGTDGSIQYESVAVERILGYHPDDHVGRNIFDLVHPDDRGHSERVFAELVATPGAEGAFEVRAQHADGTWRTLECIAKNLLGDPAVSGVVINYRDITERKALEEQLVHQAFHDPLTGLANRALFGDRVAHALLRRKRRWRPVVVLFVDLDDFKTINDSLGHAAGDAVLQGVAKRLQAALRPGDTVARLGGDEFAFLLEDVSSSREGTRVAERIVAALAEPFLVGAKEVFVRASIGIAASDDADGINAGEVLRNADVAMYAAKGRNRGGYEVFKPSMHQAALARLELEADLRRALERGEFVLYFQPIVVLETGEITGFEALLRWQHPRHGLLEPAAFIAAAETTGLIVPIGEWVLERACRQARQWHDQTPSEPPLTMSINLSARELAEPGLVERVARVLEATEVLPGSIVVEITETTMVQDAEATLDTLHALKRLGIRLAIDDFGTGYSSLSYLRRLPVDILKIDRSFVRAFGAGPRESTLVDAVFRLGENLGLQTVIEGIEEAGQRERLLALGCRLGQGYLFGAPIDAPSGSRLLRRRGRASGPGTSGRRRLRRRDVA